MPLTIHLGQLRAQAAELREDSRALVRSVASHSNGHSAKDKEARRLRDAGCDGGQLLRAGLWGHTDLDLKGSSVTCYGVASIPHSVKWGHSRACP